MPVVNTFCGGDAAKPVDANWQDALKVWPDIVAHARDNGVKLAFENCPMIFSYDEWPGGHNIAYSPQVWRRILEAWGGDVGMNFDPSHLVWQMIDQARFIREFGPHILHVHAKDLMIDRDGLYERGILSRGHRLADAAHAGPRRGRLARLSSPASTAPATTGRSIIEHEDRRFEGSDELVKRGFLLARDVLRALCEVTTTGGRNRSLIATLGGKGNSHAQGQVSRNAPASRRRRAVASAAIAGGRRTTRSASPTPCRAMAGARR